MHARQMLGDLLKPTGCRFEVLSCQMLSGEVMARIRDEDPEGHATTLTGGVSLGWQPSGSTQFDVGANLGLDRNSPDVELYIGAARRF